MPSRISSTSTRPNSPENETILDPNNMMQVGKSNDIFTRTIGALSLIIMWIVWISGCISPFILVNLFLKEQYVLCIVWTIIIIFPFVYTLPRTPIFLQAIMLGCGWFKDGATLYIEDEVGKYDIKKNILLCMHPHGLFCYGFFLNGASCRAVADQGIWSGKYIPKNFSHMPKDTFGVVEPNLFKIPMIRPFLQLFGNAAPATKKQMKYFFKNNKSFGILPGGSEEIILSERGREKLYIKERKGFLKYALQHGYTIVIGYTFGEADSYYCLPWFMKERLNFLKKTKIPVFFPWGLWCFPLLPKPDVSLCTVYGNPLPLPKIENPTQAEIDQYHAKYIECLQDLYDRYKGKFGYKDRKLELF